MVLHTFLVGAVGAVVFSGVMVAAALLWQTASGDLGPLADLPARVFLGFAASSVTTWILAAVPVAVCCDFAAGKSPPQVLRLFTISAAVLGVIAAVLTTALSSWLGSELREPVVPLIQYVFATELVLASALAGYVAGRYHLRREALRHATRPATAADA